MPLYKSNLSLILFYHNVMEAFNFLDGFIFFIKTSWILMMMLKSGCICLVIPSERGEIGRRKNKDCRS